MWSLGSSLYFRDSTSSFNNERYLRWPVTKGHDRQVKLSVIFQNIKGGFLFFFFASAELNFLYSFSHCSTKVARGGKCIFFFFSPSRISRGDTFSLGDATFLFYVNKSLGAEQGSGLSVNFDY